MEAFGYIWSHLSSFSSIIDAHLLSTHYAFRIIDIHLIIHPSSIVNCLPVAHCTPSYTEALDLMAEYEQIHQSATLWPMHVLGKRLYRQRWSIVPRRHSACVRASWLNYTAVTTFINPLPVNLDGGGDSGVIQHFCASRKRIAVRSRQFPLLISVVADCGLDEPWDWDKEPLDSPLASFASDASNRNRLSEMGTAWGIAPPQALPRDTRGFQAEVATPGLDFMGFNTVGNGPYRYQTAQFIPYLPYMTILTYRLVVPTEKRLQAYPTSIDWSAIAAAGVSVRQMTSIATGLVSTTRLHLTSAMSQDAVDLKGGSRGRTITRPIFAMFIGNYLKM